MLNDWFGTNAVSPKKPPFIRKLKDYIHAILSFPIAMVSEREKNFFKNLIFIYFTIFMNHQSVCWSDILGSNVCGS